MKYELNYTSDWEEAQQLAFKGWEMCGTSTYMLAGSTISTYYYFKRTL